MAAPISVLLVDDHGVVRDGLKALLEAQPDIAVVGMAADGWEAISEAERLQPDVAVMDLTLPQLNGIDASELLLKRSPQTRIVILSMYHSSEHVCRALRAGAVGYVVKEAAGRELVDAVRAAFGGQHPLSRQISNAVLDRIAHEPLKSPVEQLSLREREVLQLTVAGFSSAQTGERLYLSSKTVDSYRSRVMHKLGVRDLAGLIHFAIQNSLVPPQ